MLKNFDQHEDIAPDEIFLDDRNIPDFDVYQFEGRMESPIRLRTIYFLGACFFFLGIIFITRAEFLEVEQGTLYAQKSENNRLEHQILFPERGIIYDRNNKELAWNTPSTEELGFSLRSYIDTPGYGNILGFLHYPARDRSGVYYRKDYEANSGVEKFYNEQLKGKNGLRIIETDALGNVVSSNVIDPPQRGEDLKLTIDADLQSKFYDSIGTIARSQDYLGGAGAIMDVDTGALLALVSYPNFDPNIMTSGDDTETIVKYNADKRTPFLDRAVSGLYTPGSIVKPIFALGGLTEGIITPDTIIVSRGKIVVPNPYFPDKDSVFNDWSALGPLDVRGAIAQSSDVFFYEVAGGFEGQKGLGIRNVEKYARMFGYGSTTGIDLYGEQDGTIPDPEWKRENFPNDPTWRVGDTYFTGIGQYGVQITPLQAVREAATLAAKGKVVTPHLWDGANNITTQLPISEANFTVIHEGMRRGAISGTGKVLNLPFVKIASKTGTAELGVTKARVNSWVIGFFPYDKPKYAFAIVMERGVKGNTTNAAIVARNLFIWMAAKKPEYLGRTTPYYMADSPYSPAATSTASTTFLQPITPAITPADALLLGR